MQKRRIEIIILSVLTFVLAALLFFGLFASSVPLGGFNSSRIVGKQLRGVRTVSQEEAAFAQICARTRVAFDALDAAGNRLDMSKEKWWESAVTIRFYCKDKAIDHKLISSDNIGILMRE